MKSYRVYTDGGARGNPGPAGCGILVFDEDNKLIDFLSSYIGETTNNVAEYEALLLSFDLLKANKITKNVTFCMDSELIVKQMRGEYKVKDPKLKAYNSKVHAELKNIKDYEFVHVPRKENKFADKLVNLALDIRK